MCLALLTTTNILWLYLPTNNGQPATGEDQMARAARKPEIRWVVVRDYYSERGDNVTEDWCILYGTEDEAKECMARLNDPARADRSFFNPDDGDDAGFLYVDQVTL